MKESKQVELIHLTNSTIESFVKETLDNIPDYRDYALLAFYRGGLPLGVRFSNILKKPLHTIFMQTRDKKLEYHDIIYPNIDVNENSLMNLIVIEDIIDSGKTIEKFMEDIEKDPIISNIHEVHVYALVGDESKVLELMKKYNKLKIHVHNLYDSLEGKWIIFPWEEKPNVPNNQLITSAEALFREALDILIRKNHDYTGGELYSNPFKNFENVEKLNIAKTEQGILVRLSDKFARLSGLLINNVDSKVKDESIHDTIQDAINYLAILDAYIKYKGERNV